jgi:hypothetical protein
MSAVDPVTLQVIQARLAGIVQEMQNSLFRSVSKSRAVSNVQTSFPVLRSSM